jgi:hypothetical protein
MSPYRGHRGPNVSQYIANLNQLSPQDSPIESHAPAEDFSAFLNGDFFDADNGVFDPIPSIAPIDLDVDIAEQATQSDIGVNARKHIHASAPTMDFNLNGKYSLFL